METGKVVNHAISELISNVNYQIFTKETFKKIPEHTFNALDRLKDHIIFVGNIPKPIYKRQPIIQEELMPRSPSKEILIPSSIPLMRLSQLQIKTPSTSKFSRRKNMSRYASTTDKNQLRQQIHLDLTQVKQNEVIEVANRSQQNTAKTFRSAIEIDSQIAQLRKTYLKNLKKEEQLKKVQTKLDFSLMRKKRLPKQFTFDFSGQLLEKRNLAAKGIVFSPLRTKSVSIQKIHKKVQESRNNSEEESNNLQEVLERAKTGSRQKKKRQYNNLSRRQVSHIPYISLVDNTKLYQNNTKLEGQPKNALLVSTVHSSRKSSFMHYSQKNKEKEDSNFNMHPNTFPKSFKPATKQKIGQGRITKIKALDDQIQNRIQDQFQDHTEKTIFNIKI